MSSSWTCYMLSICVRNDGKGVHLTCQWCHTSTSRHLTKNLRSAPGARADKNRVWTFWCTHFSGPSHSGWHQVWFAISLYYSASASGCAVTYTRLLIISWFIEPSSPSSSSSSPPSSCFILRDSDVNDSTFPVNELFPENWLSFDGIE